MKWVWFLSFIKVPVGLWACRKPYPLRIREMGCKNLKYSKTLKQLLKYIYFPYKSEIF